MGQATLPNFVMGAKMDHKALLEKLNDITDKLTIMGKEGSATILRQVLIDVKVIKPTEEISFEELMEEFEYVKYVVRMRVHDEEFIGVGCANQPAGVPVIVNDPNLRIVLAPYYSELHPRQKRARRKKDKAEIKEKKDKVLKKLMSTANDKEIIEVPRFCPWYSEKNTDNKTEVWIQRRWFWSEYLATNVSFWENKSTGKCKMKIHNRADDSSHKLELYVNTYAASKAYTLESELKAMEKLRGHVTDNQYLSYVTTGTIMERSKKTGLVYIFRKMRPTIVFRDCDHKKKIVGILCMHSQGYYGMSWAGTLPPTDDVIVHILFMRSDERMYWKKSNQHKPKSAEANF